MSDESKKAEHDLIKEGLPLINMMGAQTAAERSTMNEATKAQLAFVRDQLDHYLPTAPRGWGDDSKMPHEWGSMDTYDDMRNSLRFAAILMDGLLDPFIEVTDEVEELRVAIVIAECGLCAVADEVLALAGLDDEGDGDEYQILARTARRVEAERGLEPNTLFPSDN
jgi:hypothetical protein